ncbi:hypothetical protein COX68_02395 [Candidatus Falkowbacteria bacterium CG_4_10_14_0_2_um_filter_41_15]|uniref:Uncharacterized protein n=4 Tax=Candidatus Falkowiibacteriota TaxID=1752728 RepID=A0A2G9ZPE9_9BACT|nr:MAG: hypothetical protein AUJ35_02735 [Candidatus Falkowbacteria bacterium CG1_02_41_21]PIP34460.1 MAG: hypothetical protein COX21_02805 [Candidatus Falkowbacteria bacterium CG23_combo_of_CG06-09_8_20_14_all_41_10]PIZ10264.1 MAG: hypothetical protein COY54_01740 [Candidatus Falkowbacteria bacterium CG_4_10_14_0_8_um_filter_41_36]PJA09615.1 MAG: hypothetical protein COX68_02395 [Candidatus Falkowbacteria bacterium CG_4_10_14_0_2_um_filter_41_15]
MRSDKILALKLRENGKTYSQISSILDIPKSTLSTWLKDVVLSEKAKDKIQKRVTSTSIYKLITRNKQRTIIARAKHKQIYQLAKKEAPKFLSDALFICGTSLYWAEGYKQGAMGSKWKSIDFTNADPQMIKLMIKFFTKFLGLEKSQIRIQIMLHDSKNSERAINFWHKLTGIPRQNFFKTCCSISQASLQKRNRKLQYGTIHLRINDVIKFFRLMGWIEGLKEKFNV